MRTAWLAVLLTLVFASCAHAQIKPQVAGQPGITLVPSSGPTVCNPPAVSCVTVPSGLVFWMPFDTLTTSGTTTNDVTANANNGILTGGATINVGEIHQAEYLNGTTQYAKITSGAPWNAYTTAPAANTPFTVTAWIYRTGDTGTFMQIASRGYNGTITVWVMEINTSTLTGAFNSYNGTSTIGVIATSATSTLNTWEFWAASWDGVSTWSMSKNAGTATTATSTAGPATVTAEPLEIGAVDVTGNPLQFFPGRIDDVRIYNRVLSSGELTSIYNSGLAGQP